MTTVNQTAEYQQISKSHLSSVINGKAAGVLPLIMLTSGGEF
jgi:hypothetical protein